MSMIDRQPSKPTSNQQAKEFWLSDEGLVMIDNLLSRGYAIRTINLLVFERMFANFAYLGDGERALIEEALGETTLAELQELYPALRE